MNWKNVNLQDGYERDQNILEPYSFDTLLLECHCNIPMQNVNRETVKQQFETELNNKIMEDLKQVKGILYNWDKEIKEYLSILDTGPKIAFIKRWKLNKENFISEEELYNYYNHNLQIAIEKFKELYKKWVDNSINKKFADKVFYLQQDHKIKGFVTLKKYENSASIGLIAVESNSQGKGYGSMLLEKVEHYCDENKIVELQIPTQKENRSACQFYSKLGYIIIQEINIKHYWNIMIINFIRYLNEL
jgi:ribosomal protein S18 acetylase RimI-like enzyme